MELKQDGVIRGSVRVFFKAFAAVVGIAIGIGIVAMGLSMVAGPQYLPSKATPIIRPDGQGNRGVLSETAPVILSIDIRGTIGMLDLTSDKVENLLLDSQEDFLKGRVKGVFLHMNTPGGAADDSDTIYRALLAYKAKYKVPIYAYVDGLCASGGMYIASAADKIYASPPSVIGSVGVLMGPNFNFAGLMERYGVGALTLTEGKDKDEMNPFRPWKPNEGALLQPILAGLYDRFIDIVTAARPRLTKRQLVGEYGARVFLANEAEKLGYIDHADASYEEAMQELAMAAHIGEKEPYQVFQLQPPRPFLGELARVCSPVHVVRAALGISQKDMSELNGRFLYYYQP